ncbi:MAG: aminotransferase class IV family protein, partial [Paracoccaceae bacterium]
MESSFRDTCPDDLRVIETLCYDPAAGMMRRDLHLARMALTCARLSIPLDQPQVLTHLAGIGGSDRLRVRISIGRTGDIDLVCHPLPDQPAIWRVAISPDRLRSDDPWLSVKTTVRRLYDNARAALPDGVDEVIFLNERAEVCEGTISNIFVASGDRLLTPPVSCGLLPGILRETLLRDGTAEAAVLKVADLAAAPAVFVGNSARGL